MTILKSLKTAFRAAIKSLGEESLILIPSDPKVILELGQKAQEAQVAEQLRQLKKSVYHMASRVNDQTEHINALTTTLQENQHDLDQAGKQTQPEPLFTSDQLMGVSRAWKKANDRSWLTAKKKQTPRPD